MVLQPSWRAVEDWPLDRNIDPAGKDWGTLLRGGNNGLYLAIVSLGWWVLGATKYANERPVDWQDLVTVLADVEWVLDNVLTQARGPAGVALSSSSRPVDPPHVSPSLKRPADSPTDMLPPKRHRKIGRAHV